MRHSLTVIPALFLSALIIGCAEPAAPGRPANPEIILATTTSTQDSGLLDLLIPLFNTQTRYVVKTIAVGSGQAMTMGERGEADVLLVHAPDAEVTFMKNGHGTDRRLVMHNDFIIVGPAADPARVRGAPSAVDALNRIRATSQLFISRGDNSGTDQFDKRLWRAAGVTPEVMGWYQQTGQGMGATLAITSDKGGYTIADRATYLTTSKNSPLVVLVEGDPILLNIYHVIPVNPNKSPRINAAGAKAFADFMVAPETQAVIGQFGVEKFGQPLFFPDAGKPEPA